MHIDDAKAGGAQAGVYAKNSHGAEVKWSKGRSIG
jgi:hypothetical protein